MTPTTTFAVPWSNSNANYQDGGVSGWTKTPGSHTTVPANTIATMPRYNIERIKDYKIETHNGNANAIANIKVALDNNNAVLVAPAIQHCPVFIVGIGIIISYDKHCMSTTLQ